MIPPFYFILDKEGTQFNFETINFDEYLGELTLNTFNHSIKPELLEYVIAGVFYAKRPFIYDVINIIDYDKERNYLKLKIEQLDLKEFDYQSWLREKRIDFILDLF